MAENIGKNLPTTRFKILVNENDNCGQKFITRRVFELPSCTIACFQGHAIYFQTMYLEMQLSTIYYTNIYIECSKTGDFKQKLVTKNF